MKQYGLLGFPLSQSFSKQYFSEKFRKEAIDAVFDTFPIPDINAFPSLIQSLPTLAGMNVTIPYKQAVMPFLDGLDAEAAAIGAVNVIRVERVENSAPKLIGYNSDLVGFRESIRPLIERLKTRFERSEDIPLKALVLGTGGASKAVLYGFHQLGIETQLVSRRAASGQITYEDLTPHHYEAFRIIVNTTPLGMAPNINTCPLIDYSLLGKCHLLFDAVYNPDKTLFLQKGEQQGAIIKNGLEMLHLQAEAAWEIWNRLI